MFIGLGEERKRFRKKKTEKKTKNKKFPSRLKMVDRDKRLFKDILPCENFSAVLSPFLNETAFYVNLLWRFSGPKTKAM